MWGGGVCRGVGGGAGRPVRSHLPQVFSGALEQQEGTRDQHSRWKPCCVQAALDAIKGLLHLGFVFSASRLPFVERAVRVGSLF